jgi:hypothetical protein
MAERKKSAKKKAPAKKAKARPAAGKSSAPAKKKTAARKKSPARKPASEATRKKPASAAKPTPKPVAPPAPQKAPAPVPLAAPAGTVGADEVLLGHVMALRPRIHVGFKPSAFADAKRALVEERYASIETAARAVAEKAIEISNASSRQDPFSRR